MTTAAFAAVEALTRALAVELGPRRVNTIRPGYTDSDFWTFLPDQDRKELRRVGERMSVRRLGTPRGFTRAAVSPMTCPLMIGTVLEVKRGRNLGRQRGLTTVIASHGCNREWR
jgi:NAD(P)-dependent dehydrogenase (short-subunit alcohol dehydrogenase family)